MTVSIICPVFNEEKYLAQCIGSVLNQSLKDIELILINDGSTDESGKICDQYALKDPRVKVIHQPNQGISIARENGFLAAKGEYIGFVDGDDFLLPEMYERLLDLLVQHKADIAICDYFSLDIPEVREETPLKVIESFFGLTRPLRDSSQKSQNESITIILWNKIYKRELFEKINYLQYKPIIPFHYFDDAIISYMLIHESKKIIKTSEKLLFYRQLEGSLSRDNSLKILESLLRCSKIRLTFLKENGYERLYNEQKKDYGNRLIKLWLKTGDEKYIEEFKQVYREIIIKAKYNPVYKISFMMFRISPKLWVQIAKRFKYTHVDGERL